VASKHKTAVSANNQKRRPNPFVVISVTIIVVSVLAGVAFWGLGRYGRNDILSRVPIIGRNFASGSAAEKTPEEELAEARMELEADKVALAAAQAAAASEKQTLDALRAELEAREAALAAAETELAAARAGLLSEEESIARMARMTAGMPPKDAVPILENLGDDLAVKVIAAMSDKDGAAILAVMDPTAAARLLQALHE
jgi:flagellar motility protein MotE (MotC chaperone)